MLGTQRRNQSSTMSKKATNGNGKASAYAHADFSVHAFKDQQGFDPLQAQGTMPHLQTYAARNLTEDFDRMNLQPADFAAASSRANSRVSTNSYDGGVPLNGPIAHNSIPQVPLLYNGGVFQVHPGIAPHANGLGHPPSMYTSVGQPYLGQNGFHYPHQFVNGASPLSSWPSSRVPSSEMPTLVTPRRDSSSSHENDFPGTPFTQYANYNNSYSGGVTIVDRSPHSGYAGAWSTPSPQYMTKIPSAISSRLELLINQHPAIPRAIPAPYSPIKPLDRALENPNGVTNVYVRGLHTDTTDEMLHKLAARFGDIVSSKSIIDHATGKCKGYGFVKYHNFKDAEDCIRGFHHMGYETSFARESFYSQLKKLSDEGNTNLYVSNLPRDCNEHELGKLFEPYKVCSSRILRDLAGNGRGVGFARFESRDVCEQIIKEFNNKPVPGYEDYLVQIRYADTPDQKNLKQQTNAARQFRAAEYESQTNGSLPMVVPHARFGGDHVVDNDFETYMASSNSAQRRLKNFSGHFGTPRVQPPAISVNLPNTPVAPSRPETRVATADIKPNLAELSSPASVAPTLEKHAVGANTTVAAHA